MELKRGFSAHDGMKSYGALEQTTRRGDAGDYAPSSSPEELEAEMARIQRLREVLVRRESELRFMMDDLQLCKDIDKLKQELRSISSTSDEGKREQELLQMIHQLVQKRDFLVDDAEVERLREQEEDLERSEILKQKTGHAHRSPPQVNQVLANKPSIQQTSAALIRDCCGATRCTIM